MLNYVFDYASIYDYLINTLATDIEQNYQNRNIHFQNASKNVAKYIYAKCQEIEWVIFLRNIVGYYSEYEKEEKDKLLKELKNVLSNAIRLIIAATNKNIEEISDLYDGRFKGSTFRHCVDKDGSNIDVGILREIYKKEYSYTKENILNILTGYAKEYKPLAEYDCAYICNKLVEEISSSGHEHFIAHLAEVRYLWSEKQLFWESAIWAHLRSFVAAVESLSKEWYGKDGKGMLGHNIEKAFGEDYKNIQRDIEPSINLTKADTLNELKSNFSKIVGTHENLNKDNSLCNRNMIITHLVRNYLMHNIKTEENQLRTKEFGVIFNSLIYTVLSLYCQHVSSRKC